MKMRKCARARCAFADGRSKCTSDNNKKNSKLPTSFSLARAWGEAKNNFFTSYNTLARCFALSFARCCRAQQRQEEFHEILCVFKIFTKFDRHILCFFLRVSWWMLGHINFWFIFFLRLGEMMIGINELFLFGQTMESTERSSIAAYCPFSHALERTANSSTHIGTQRGENKLNGKLFPLAFPLSLWAGNLRSLKHPFIFYNAVCWYICKQCCVTRTFFIPTKITPPSFVRTTLTQILREKKAERKLSR